MRAKKVLGEVLQVVAEQTDIEVEKIMSRKRELEAVDARHICVKLLRERGLYPSRIAEVMGMTPRNVCYILSDFDTRVMFNREFRNNYEASAKEMGKRLETSR